MIYRPHPNAPGEEGVLVGFGHRTVWVRLGAEKTAMPTSRSYLSWPVRTASAAKGGLTGFGRLRTRARRQRRAADLARAARPQQAVRLLAPGESYSDVIIRLVALQAPRRALNSNITPSLTL